MDPTFIQIAIAVFLIILLFGARLFIRSITVHEYETGLLYRRGRLQSKMGAGLYRICRLWSNMILVDMRRQVVTITGQEVLSADHVSLKISLVMSYSVENPEQSIHLVQDYTSAFYTTCQLALRALITETKIDELLEQRAKIGLLLTEKLQQEASTLGLKLYWIDIKDIMFPGELKKIFTEVIKAQKEGLAALERARGESAALRSLANTAKLLEDNPALFQLRLLQTVATPNHPLGNSIVFNVPPGTIPIERKSKV